MKATVIPSGPLHVGRRVTREAYLDLPDDGYKYDMIEGVLQLTPSPLFEHGRAAGRFMGRLQSFLTKNPIGVAVPEIDVLLPDGGDVLRPDISFILTEHMGIVIQHIHGAPDLVCEILSDSTAVRDRGIKADRYLKSGVTEYWLVDPRDRSVAVLYNETRTTWIEQTQAPFPSRVLPGLSISAAELFG